MTQPLADVLVLSFPPEATLGGLATRGTLLRDWGLVERLRAGYARLIVLTPGPATEVEIARTLPGAAEVIANADALEPQAFAAAAGLRLRATTQGIGRALVKTQAMTDAGLGLAATHALRSAGIVTALVAYSTHLHSRFMARELGPDHRRVRLAGVQEARVCAAADAVIGTSGSMVDELAWRHGVPMARAHVIPNFVDDHGDVPSAEQREPGLVLFAGDLVQRKRVDLIIRAIGTLPEERRAEITFEVAGAGPERPALEALAAERGVRAVFLGAIPNPDLLARMRAASVYVHMSQYEGHPRAVVEAMSCGCPVVVTNSPGLASSVENGHTGLIVPAEPESVGYAITGLMDDIGWRDQLGSCASRVVRQRLGLATVATQELQVHGAAMVHAESVAANKLPSDTPSVRWDATLLNAPAEDAAAAWHHAVLDFATQLPAADRPRFDNALRAVLDRRRSA